MTGDPEKTSTYGPARRELIDRLEAERFTHFPSSKSRLKAAEQQELARTVTDSLHRAADTETTPGTNLVRRRWTPQEIEFAMQRRGKYFTHPDRRCAELLQRPRSSVATLRRRILAKEKSRAAASQRTRDGLT